MTPTIDKLESLRLKISETKRLIYSTKNAQLPREEAEAQKNEYLARFTQHRNFGEIVEAFFNPHGVVDRPLERAFEEHPAEMLAALCREALSKSLDEAIAQYSSEHPHGLPRAQRAKKIQELEKTLFELERSEEDLICVAEAAGIAGFYRRADVDPAIVLGIID